jgi:hypothetical protein
MAAHSQVTNVVEKNDTGRAGAITRLDQQCTDQHVRAARLIYDRGPEPVVLGAKDLQFFGYAAPAEVRPAAHDGPGWLTGRVGVNDGNSFHDKSIK